MTDEIFQVLTPIIIILWFCLWVCLIEVLCVRDRYGTMGSEKIISEFYFISSGAGN
jgi:hypothetical protein